MAVVVSVVTVGSVLYRNFLRTPLHLPAAGYRFRSTHYLQLYQNESENREKVATHINKQNGRDQLRNWMVSKQEEATKAPKRDVIQETITHMQDTEGNRQTNEVEDSEIGEDGNRDVENINEKPTKEGVLFCVNVTDLLMRNEFNDTNVKDKFKWDVSVMLTSEADRVSDVAARWWNVSQSDRQI